MFHLAKAGSRGREFSAKKPAVGRMLFFLCLLFLLYPVRSAADDAVNNLSFDLYSQEHGLSNNQIHSILQDSQGWIWIGTSQGVCRFDGYRFTVFRNNPDDPGSLKGNLVRIVFEDRKGQLWVGTENGGLNKFNRDTETFRNQFYDSDRAPLKDVSVTSITEDPEGRLWVGTEGHVYRMEDDETLSPVRPSNFPDFSEYFRVIKMDRSGRLWLGTNRGVFLYHPSANRAESIKIEGTLQNEEIWEIVPDLDGKTWIGTYSSGMFSVDSRTLEAKQVPIDPENERSLTVRAILKDLNGKYWIGTRGGLYVYSPAAGITAKYYHDDREPKSLVNNSVLALSKDAKGNIWIGTRQGLNLLIGERINIIGYKSRVNDDRYLNNSEIYSFWLDPDGKIWIGTENGGINVLDRKTGRFTYLMPRKGNPNSLSSTCIKALEDDGNKNLWIGTFLGGLDIYNRQTGSFRHFRNDPSDPGSLSDNKVWSLLKDSRGHMWIGTSRGLDRYDPKSGSFIHYPNLVNGQAVNWIREDRDHCLWIGATDMVVIYDPESQKVTRIGESTRYMHQDPGNRYWLATLSNGIALYSKEKGIIKYYSEREGLANNQALAILEDNEGYLWISTTNGLSRFDPAKERFHNFSIKSGFQNDQFTYGAACKLPSGELMFGGISGFNIFDPAKIKSGDYFAPIVFTDLKILNKSVRITPDGSGILSKSISMTSGIELKYEQNSVEIEFASFDFANILGIQYSYFLENFDNDWNEPSDKRLATYTNLNPGTYTFRVRTLSIDRQESNTGPVLTITVRPPYWQTWWFRLLIFLTILGLLSWLILFLQNREKLKHNLAFEKIKAKKLHEFDMMKLRFYTNISHEIRTPLTLILGPLDKLRKGSVPEPEIKGHLEVMHRNATQLHQLINQLLDYRKMESGNLKLNLKKGDLVSFLAGIVGSFEKYAEEKEIDLKFNSLKKEIVTSFDEDKIAKIMNNLLSNAFKFTAKGGKIVVNVSLIFDADNQEAGQGAIEKRVIEITVRDTGIGISESNIEKIFNRFFQVDQSPGQAGTGIGLALTKELVKLHNGKIFATSKPGKSSKFTIHLPYEEVKATAPAEPGGSGVETGEEHHVLSDESGNELAIAGQKIMLLVDDNADVRYFIKSHFSSGFKILEATNGLEGWNMALKTIPNIIISDVLMPDMDGFEFCRRVRKDERTSHIPILLLTALGSREHEIEGLSQGADDYITKPFDLGVLQTKVENILSLRQSLKQKYSGEVFLQPRNIILSSPDERFLQKAIAVVENNIADPDLDIDRFATEIGVSRMQLYRKLNAMTEMTVKEFIRDIRLKRAAQMLVQRKMNVSEVAYAVGFKDLSHFRKCFKQEFNMSASEFAEKHSSPEE